MRPYEPRNTPPDDESQAYVRVSSAATGQQHYLAELDSTIAFIPQVERPEYPNHYGNFLVFEGLPLSERPVSDRTTSFRATTGHASYSKVSWYPTGQRGPKVDIKQLPFYVDTNDVGDSVISYAEKTVPLPPDSQITLPSTQQSSSATLPTPSMIRTKESDPAKRPVARLSFFEQLKVDEAMDLKKTNRTRRGLYVPDWKQ